MYVRPSSGRRPPVLKERRRCGGVRKEASGTRLGILYGLVFLFTAAMGVATPLVPQFLGDEFLAGPYVVGLVVAVYGVLQIAARIPLGAWADRWGRRTSVLIAFGGVVGGGVCFVLADSIAWVVAGQVLYAIASSAFWVGANAYVVDVLPPPAVPRAMTHYTVAMSFGFLAGPLLGGLADAFGYRVAFGAFLAAGVAGCVLGAMLLDTGRSDRRVSLPEAFRLSFAFLKDPVLRFSAAGTFTFALLLGATSAFLPLHLRALGYGAAFVGVLFTVREGASLALRLGFARHLTAERSVPAMLGGIALAAVAVAAFPFAPGTWALVALSVTAGVGIGAVIPANLTLIASAAPADQRSLAMGLYGTALGVGGAVAPPLLGAVGERWGLLWTFVGAAAVALLLLAALALTAPTLAASRRA